MGRLRAGGARGATGGGRARGFRGAAIGIAVRPAIDTRATVELPVFEEA